jgi:hypothetical protein
MEYAGLIDIALSMMPLLLHILYTSRIEEDSP